MSSRSSRRVARLSLAVAMVAAPVVLTESASHAGMSAEREGSAVYHSTLVVDGAWDSRVGGDGSYYVTGTAPAGGMPSTPGAYVEPQSNGEGAFVTRYDPTGQVAWQLTLGGNVSAGGERIAVGSDGSVYVAGSVIHGAHFPTTPGAMSDDYVGPDGDSFLAKFSADGTRLIYSTLLPGVFVAPDLEVDDQGRAVLAGEAYADLPTSPGALRSSPPSPDEVGSYAVEVKQDGSAYRWATYLPGTDGTEAKEVELGPDGEVVVGGTTFSSDFPTTGGIDAGPQGYDPFISVLSADGTSLVASARFGSPQAGAASMVGLSVDDGSVWANGLTEASDFQTTPNAWFPTKPAGVTRAMWVVRLPLSLDSFDFSTYLPANGGGEIHAAPGDDAVVDVGGRMPSDFPRPGDDADSAFLFLHPDGSLDDAFEPNVTPRDFDVDRAGTLYTMSLGGAASGRAAAAVHQRAVLGRYARCTIRGTSGDDVLRGTRGPDVICGRGGDDVILGRGSYDVLRGNDGHDVLRGGHGIDVLSGGPGRDLLAGDSRRDLVTGGPGADRVHGGAGPDTLHGGPGQDLVDGGSGRDHCGDPQRSTRFRACENHRR